MAKAAAMLSRKPDDLAERARLEVFIARELYGLDAADWAHLTLPGSSRTSAGSSLGGTALG